MCNFHLPNCYRVEGIDHLLTQPRWNKWKISKHDGRKKCSWCFLTPIGKSSHNFQYQILLNLWKCYAFFSLCCIFWVKSWKNIEIFQKGVLVNVPVQEKKKLQRPRIIDKLHDLFSPEWTRAVLDPCTMDCTEQIEPFQDWDNGHIDVLTSSSYCMYDNRDVCKNNRKRIGTSWQCNVKYKHVQLQLHVAYYTTLVYKHRAKYSAPHAEFWPLIGDPKDVLPKHIRLEKVD